jgi:hypothetical protein
MDLVKRLFGWQFVVLICGAFFLCFGNGQVIGWWSGKQSIKNSLPQVNRDYEVFLESYKSVPLPNLTIYLGDATGLRYKKFNHSVYALSGSAELAVEVDQTITVRLC